MSCCIGHEDSFGGGPNLYNQKSRLQSSKSGGSKPFGGTGEDMLEYKAEWVANYENKVVPSRWGWQIESTVSYTWNYTTQIIYGVGDRNEYVNWGCKENPTSNNAVNCRIPTIQLISTTSLTGLGTQGVMTFCKPDYWKIPRDLFRIIGFFKPDSWWNAKMDLSVENAVNHIFADPSQPCQAYFVTKAQAEAALDQPPNDWSIRPSNISLPNALATDILYDAMNPCLSDNPQNALQGGGCEGRTQGTRPIRTTAGRWGSCDYMKRAEILGPGNIPMKDERTIEFPSMPQRHSLRWGGQIPRGPWKRLLWSMPPGKIGMVMAGNCP